MYQVAIITGPYHDGADELEVIDIGHMLGTCGVDEHHEFGGTRAARAALGKARQCFPGRRWRIIRETADTVVVYDRY